MKIKTRLTINFTILVAAILAFSSISVYLFAKTHRNEDFLNRLRVKAINTAVLYINVSDIDAHLLKTIDDNTINTLTDVKVWVLDDKKKVLYSTTDSASSAEILPAFSAMRWHDGNVRVKNNVTYLCLKHQYEDKNYFVLATSMDVFGLWELKNLKLILLSVLGISLAFTFIAGFINARESLKPIKEIISQVDNIKPSNLGSRVTTDSKDEIAELAQTFNKLIDRIEQAFETERMFVSNASHELRTPVTSIKGQVEVGLQKTRSLNEYQTILQSIHEDVNNMTVLINGFLELAETNIEPGRIGFEKIRLDEMVFGVKEEMDKRNPNNKIYVEFENIPDDEGNISINGNYRLLRIMLSNLIDNSCKFSANRKAIVQIGHNSENVFLKVSDSGIGIPEAELNNIFLPLYRTANVSNIPGNGIGLSIVNRICSLHNAKLLVKSEVNVGTTFTISFNSYFKTA